MSASSDLDLDLDLNSDESDGSDFHSGCCYKTNDGIIVYPRSDIPKKEFDFKNIPRCHRSDFPTYAFATLAYTVPWCGPDSVPLNPEQLEKMRSDAQFILVTDSSDTFVNLFANDCHIRHKFFLVKGSADECTCYFLRLLKREWRIPIVALVDYEPISLKLLSFYESWTPKGMPWCFSGVKLDIKWLGIRHIHLDSPEDPLTADVIRSRIFSDMDDEDLAIATSLLDDDFVNKSEERVAEVKRMIHHKLMIIVVALHYDFLLDTYLPALVDDKKWWI